MQCEVCHNTVATVHLTDVSNNTKKEIHLCDTCAKEKGATIKSHMNTDASFPELKTAELMTTEFGDLGGEGENLVCSTCGMNYRKFRSTGKFGCPQDYEVFGRHVIQLLEKIHHKVQHTGKIPSRADRNLSEQKKLHQLRDELKRAIATEEYERAAAIRDKIYSLEGRRETKK